MKLEELFKFSAVFNSKPVYRNTNQRKDFAAFDDLSDPQDSEQGARLAIWMANRVRTSAEPGARTVEAVNYAIAIARVFKSTVFPSRYGDGTYPVWYGSTDQETTIFETAGHMARIESGLRGHSKTIVRRRIIFEVTCTAILLDLTRQKKFYDHLIDPDNYSFTQQIGKRVRMEGHPGLLAPSARRKDGINLAIFTPIVLTDPKQARTLEYRLDLSSMQITVVDEDQKVLRTIGTVPAAFQNRDRGRVL